MRGFDVDDVVLVDIDRMDAIDASFIEGLAFVTEKKHGPVELDDELVLGF